MAAECIRIAARLGLPRPPKPRKEGSGQIVFPFSLAFACALVRYHRTSTRIVWDCYRSSADRLEPLYSELTADIAADDRGLVRDGDTISIESKRIIDFAASDRQVVGVVKNALIDGAAKRGVALELDPEYASTRWVVRQDDRGDLVVALDLGGGSLSQRGWRLDHGDAPLREHLASVLLMLCRFDPRVDTIVDPMCGSATIPIEALHMAKAVAREGQLGLRNLDEPEFAPALFADASPLAIGCDVDLSVLAGARRNAKRAQVEEDLVLQRCDLADLTPELIATIARERNRTIERGLFVINPPYGERLDPGDLRLLYGMMSDSLRQFAGWRAGFLVASPEFEPIMGQPRIKQPLSNGQLRAYFYLYEF